MAAVVCQEILLITRDLHTSIETQAGNLLLQVIFLPLMLRGEQNTKTETISFFSISLCMVGSQVMFSFVILLKLKLIAASISLFILLCIDYQVLVLSSNRDVKRSQLPEFAGIWPLGRQSHDRAVGTHKFPNALDTHLSKLFVSLE